MATTVSVRRLSPSAPAHWLVTFSATGCGPTTKIELVDTTTGDRLPPTGRVVRIDLGVSAGASGATEAAPVLSTSTASPTYTTTVLGLDPIPDGDSVSQALATPIPYAIHPDGPLYLHAAVNAGTATLAGQILVLGGWQ